jgi:hypothetical protein
VLTHATMSSGNVNINSGPTMLRGRCVGGEVNLSRYPNLAYSNNRVHTHLAGVPIEDVVAEADALNLENGSVSLITAIESAAEHLGVTLDELLDAVRYARANSLI